MTRSTDQSGDPVADEAAVGPVIQESDIRALHKMSAAQARNALMRQEYYSLLRTPSCLVFEPVLQAVAKGKGIRDLVKALRACKRSRKANRTIHANVDEDNRDKPYTFINPCLYRELVYFLTKPMVWKLIRDRFRHFRLNSMVECCSMPVVSMSTNASQWPAKLSEREALMQATIRSATRHPYMLVAKIHDFYGSILTHAVAWAVHDREVAKESQMDWNLEGNVIDSLLRATHEGQSNGIPRNSLVMDLIAELVLAYIDVLLTERLRDDPVIAPHLASCHIIRARGEYRILASDPTIREKILNRLVMVLHDFGLNLDSNGGQPHDDVLGYLAEERSQREMALYRSGVNPRDFLLQRHQDAQIHPNSDGLELALGSFFRRMPGIMAGNVPLYDIAIILTWIVVRNQRVFPEYDMIMKRLLVSMAPGDRERTVTDIIEIVLREGYTEYSLLWITQLLSRVIVDVSGDVTELIAYLLHGGDPQAPDAPQMWDLSLHDDPQEVERLSQFPVVIPMRLAWLRKRPTE